MGKKLFHQADPQPSPVEAPHSSVSSKPREAAHSANNQNNILHHQGQDDPNRWSRAAPSSALRDRRQADRAAYEKSLEDRKGRNNAREKTRWDRMQLDEAREVERGLWLREHSSKAKRNQGGLPFNILTLAYDESGAGRKLEFKDEVDKYQQDLRTLRLAVASSVGLDAITGRKTLELNQPTPPKEKP
eukprot:GHVT01075425.1.p1 GENE.GHVT01075425.1~~GHVT01075425.1.p1  ORF type:complete len:188 (+),score=47.30 GHVT01075425.1:349-912(+)